MNNNDGRRRTHRWLSEDQKNEVRKLLKDGIRPEELAVRFDVHYNTIRNIGRQAPHLEQSHDQVEGDAK